MYNNYLKLCQTCEGLQSSIDYDRYWKLSGRTDEACWMKGEISSWNSICPVAMIQQNYSVIVNFVTVALPLFVVCAKGIRFEPFDIVHYKFTSYHFPFNFIQDRFTPTMPVCACMLCTSKLLLLFCPLTLFYPKICISLKFITIVCVLLAISDLISHLHCICIYKIRNRNSGSKSCCSNKECGLSPASHSTLFISAKFAVKLR